MRKVEDQIKNLAALTGVVLMAAAEAMAQENSSRPARRIVVSIPDRKLAVLEGNRIVRIFETAVGAPKSPSPTGTYQIVNSIADPTWYTKGKIVPPGKCNPLGTRWLGLSRKGYGIHGTNRPDSIGRNASHGCIRMRNREVEELFKMVAVGDQVELFDARDAELARLFGTPPIAASAAAAAASTAPAAGTSAAANISAAAAASTAAAAASTAPAAGTSAAANISAAANTAAAASTAAAAANTSAAAGEPAGQ